MVAAAPLAFYGQLAAAVKAVRYEISRGFAQVLYPATFLCGNGACQTCVADVAGGRRRVCQRGPVFDLTDVVIEDLKLEAGNGKLPWGTKLTPDLLIPDP